MTSHQPRIDLASTSHQPRIDLASTSQKVKSFHTICMITDYIVENEKYNNTYNSRYMYDGNGDGVEDINTLLLMFNRLVDIDNIDYITVDDEIYRLR